MTAEIRFPGVNFEAPADLTDLEFNSNSVETEVRETRRLLDGSCTSENQSWGIVTDRDPQGSTAGDGSPLSLKVNSINSKLVDLIPGIAVTPNGQRIQITSRLEGIELASSIPGAINVLYLSYLLEELRIKMTLDLVPVDSRRVLPGTDTISTLDQTAYVHVAQLATWQAISPNDTPGIVPLAIVEVDASGNLVIIHWSQTYSFLRPWFSAADVKHRTAVGTGTQTQQNIHGLSQNDLTAGNFTIWSLLDTRGLVISKDQSFPLSPGYSCSETIPLAEIYTDDGSGTATGWPLARYFFLSQFPTRILKITDNATGGTEYTGWNVAGTNMIVIPAYVDETITGDLRIIYTTADAAKPSPARNQTVLTFSQPSALESIISGGLILAQLPSPELAFLDAGQIPQRFTVMIKGNGYPIKTPQVLVCEPTLTSLGMAATTITEPLLAPSYIKVGLQNVIKGASFSIKVQLNGLDSSSNPITETLQFTSAYNQNTPGSTTENPAQFLLSTNEFSSLQTFTIVERIDDGANTTIGIYAVPNEVDSSIRELLRVAQIMWTGIGINVVTDWRPIQMSTRQDSLASITSLQGLERERILSATTACTVITCLVEDFRDPRWASSSSSFRRMDGLVGTYQSRQIPTKPDASYTDPDSFTFLLVWERQIGLKALTGSNRDYTLLAQRRQTGATDFEAPVVIQHGVPWVNTGQSSEALKFTLTSNDPSLKGIIILGHLGS